MRYVFGDYTLDTACYELCRAGQRLPLRPKVFQLPTSLIAHRDRVVLKEELVEYLWPNQCIGDEALKSCMWAARRAVGDKGRGQQVTQTLYGHGYRFMAVVPLEAPGALHCATSAVSSRPSVPPALGIEAGSSPCWPAGLSPPSTPVHGAIRSRRACDTWRRPQHWPPPWAWQPWRPGCKRRAH
jgi:DNA-binding winged helix-turn-helix (wHTH) protein